MYRSSTTEKKPSETSEDTHFIFKAIEHKDHYIPRRYVDSGVHYRKAVEVRHSSLPPSTFRFRDKLEEVFSPTSLENRISGPSNQLEEYDFVIDRREVEESQGTVPEIVSEPYMYSHGVNNCWVCYLQPSKQFYLQNFNFVSYSASRYQN